MAPANGLSPAGSSEYTSNTMYVGDGTWDSDRNTFLLPNLVGLNFDTMRYNGMGNRFRDMPQYQTLIKGHGILAVITFLFIVPAAIFIARFYNRGPVRALHLHIYLQIMTLALATVLFVLGFMAVGPNRSLTNPHHGIGVAIYVIILVQAIGGGWIYKREKGKTRRKLPVKLVLHQWLGRAVAILGMVQVPLGLCLYGSPKWTFIVYALWMFFLLVLWFILCYRALPPIGGHTGTTMASSYVTSTHGGTVIEEKKRGRGWFGPLAAGAGIAALLARNRRKSRSRSRSQSRSRVEVIPSRHGSRRGSRRDSDSFIEEKIETKKESGGLFGKVMKGAGILGAGALAKSWYDRRQEKKYGDDYSSVAQDTPSKHRRRHDSVSEDSLEIHQVHTMEEGRRPGKLLPGPDDPVLTAQPMSAAAPRPVATKPGRSHSFDSSDYSYDSTLSPSRRPRSSHGMRNGLLAGVGLGWAAKKWNERRKSKEQDRLDRLEEDARIEEERRARQGKTPTKFTGDGFPSGRRHGRRGSRTESSDLSSVLEDRHHIRADTIPVIPAALASGAGLAAMSGGRSSSQVHASMSGPPPPQPQFFPEPGSGSEQYFSSGGAAHRRHSSRRRREVEAAAAAAGAAGIAAQEEARRRSRSRDNHSDVASPPISVKVKMHGDKDRVTLRRLTEEEAAAERRSHRRRRAESASSMSGAESASNNRRYRRDRRENEARAEKLAEAGGPAMMPLSPPNPAFAKGRRPAKDSAYYSGERPGTSGIGAPSIDSPGSHGTWSAMSGSEDAAERRRRRRLERNQRPSQTVDFT